MNDPRSEYWGRIIDMGAEDRDDSKPGRDRVDFAGSVARDGRGMDDDVALFRLRADRDPRGWMFIRRTKDRGPGRAATEAFVVGDRGACVAAMTKEEKTKLGV